MKKLLFVFFISIFLAGCDSNQSIVNKVDERQANEIVVFLSSKGIAAQKIQSVGGEGPGGHGALYWWALRPRWGAEEGGHRGAPPEAP